MKELYSCTAGDSRFSFESDAVKWNKLQEAAEKLLSMNDKYLWKPVGFQIPPALMVSEEHSVAAISEVKSSIYRFDSGGEAQVVDVFWKTLLKF